MFFLQLKCERKRYDNAENTEYMIFLCQIAKQPQSDNRTPSLIEFLSQIPYHAETILPSFSLDPWDRELPVMQAA